MQSWQQNAIKELAAIVYELSCEVFEQPQDLKGRLQIVLEGIDLSEDDGIRLKASPEEQIILGIHALALLEGSALLAKLSTHSKLNKQQWLNRLLNAGRQKAEASSPEELRNFLEEILKTVE